MHKTKRTNKYSKKTIKKLKRYNKSKKNNSCKNTPTYEVNRLHKLIHFFKATNSKESTKKSNDQ